MIWSVDSVDEGKAVLESEDCSHVTVPVTELGADAREGDIFLKDLSGRWMRDPELTEKRRKELARRTAVLAGKKERPLKIFVETLGCKVNFFESAGIIKSFSEAGYETAPSMEEADIVLLNSCTVTENADRKARAFCRKVRQENPSAVLAVSGCFAQAFPEKARALGADVLMGTGNRKQTLAAVEEFLDTRKPVELLEQLKGVSYEHTEADELLEHTRAFLKIEDGCERYCTYCAIPKARGPVRSLALAEVRRQAERFAANGYKEIVLCGINLSAYGTDIGCDLGDAVLAAASPDGVERIRLSSLECDILTDEMLDKFLSCDKFCPQFHLSLQSGCDRTLKRMNRHYTASEYAGICRRIREKFDDAVFTTDIIVGFPGETEEDHLESVRFCESIGFLRTHIFPYSRRGGTMAAAMPDQITRNEKKRRAKEMSDALAPVSRRVMEGFVGRRARVIVEQDEGGWFGGYTDRYLPVKVTGSGLRNGMTVWGTVTAIENGRAVMEAE